jgi:hypothetical protein
MGLTWPPVFFPLRVHLRVAVHFGGRGLEYARADALGEAEHVDHAHHVGLDRLDGVVLIVDGRGRAGEVVDLIDLQQDRLDHVVANQLEGVVVEQVLDVRAPPREEVVEAEHLVAARQQPLARCEPMKPAPPVTSILIYPLKPFARAVLSRL